MRRCDIVIVSYNAGNLLADCVQSVLAEGACHVFVVDNDSHDDSLAHLSASISDARVTIIRNGQNLGFAVLAILVLALPTPAPCCSSTQTVCLPRVACGA